MEVITKSTYNFKNRSLNASTKRILKEGKSIKKSFYKIAAELAHIEEKKLYIEDGFDNTVDYAKKVLGVSKTNAYYLISIGRDYTVDGKKSILAHEDGTDYSIGQWKCLLPLGTEIIKELDADGVIKPSMSVRAVARVVKHHIEEVDKEESENYDEPLYDIVDPEPPIELLTIADGEVFFTKEFNSLSREQLNDILIRCNLLLSEM